MKDYLAQLARETPAGTYPRNVVREYLQARILGCLQRAGAMVPLAFQGGTALRFLCAMPRYSEGLDFALVRDESRYDLRLYLKAIEAEMSAETYDVEFKVNLDRAVQSAFIRFPGLLLEMGLSGRRQEAIAVKVEVDTRPPAGAVLATTVVRRFVLLQLQHHDRASLLAGKLNAILTRPHLKGRDLYDLVWYLADPDWPAPNPVLLNNALTQWQWTGPAVTEHKWKDAVRCRLDEVNWDEAVRDVRPFIEQSGEVELLTKENVAKLLAP